MYPEFYIEIVTPERVFYKGLICELIVESLDGLIGILKNTLPMVIGIKAGTLKIIAADGSENYAASSAGFVVVKPGEVTLLCDSVEWPEEIMLTRVQKEIEIAEEVLRHKASYRDYMLSKANLARAFAEMKLKNK